MYKFDKGEGSNKFSDYYIYLSALGSGSFGKVVRAIDRVSGQEVAIKIIRKKSFKYNKIMQIKKEAEILSSLNHPNIVRFISLNETLKRIFLVMELVSKGNLKQYLKNNKLNDLQASQVMLGILRAVDYMHSKNVIHRDIKPENILIPSFKDFSQVKLADFGLSSQFDQSFNHHMESRDCGTPIYMAPEQSNQQFYSRPVDLWSCGILMYTLIANNHPLADPTESKKSYLDKLKSPKWKFPESFPAIAKNLFLKLVELSPIERYTAMQALNHPWILRQEVKVPLTSFEKFKLYDEMLKIKGILFPIFFACAICDTESWISESEGRSEDSGFKMPRSNSVMKVVVKFKPGFKTTCLESINVKRSREGSPVKVNFLTRNLTPKDMRKYSLRRVRIDKKIR